MSLNVFSQATLAMMAQAHKLATVSQNVANINTTGYKRTDTEFQTLLSSTYSSTTADTTKQTISGNRTSDLGGVKPVDSQRISTAGQISATDRNLDVAIVGDGFFMVSPDINVNSNIQYTRRGSFEITISDRTDTITLDDGTTATVNQGYLTDQFGNYVLGVPVNADGTFDLSNPQPLRVDQYAFATNGVTTTTASFDGNLPAEDAGGTVRSANIKVIDSDFNAQNLRVDFTKAFDSDNTWDFRLLGDNIASVTTGNGAAYAGLTTTTYDPLNPTATTNVVRFSPASGGNGGTISVFTNLDPSGGAQIGTPVAGSFAGLKVGDTITIAGSGSNNGTYTIASVSDNQSEITLAASTPLAGSETTGSSIDFTSSAVIPDRLTFGNTGGLTSTDTYSFTVNFVDGTTATFDLDMSQFTQFAGAFDPGNYTQNGAERAEIQSLSFGVGGEIVGNFTDGTTRNLYKLPLAIFPNPDGLEITTGQNFRETQQSGSPTTVFGDESGFASFLGNALEGSNVDLGTEMTRLIAAQSAYNVASTAFKTADEMLQTAGGLKR